MRRGPERRFLVPEVVQTSGMDCGPASLTALMEGFGIPVSYGRLREACQTDVDGTSIDTLEDAARQLGLDAEQVMLPADHLLLPEAEALPALLVVRLPNGFTHFVVVWRVHGPWVQVMDPAVGRRWTTRRQLLRETFAHAMCVPAAAWREWAGSEEFRRVLTRRLAELGLEKAAPRLLAEAGADPGWRGYAALDAAIRLAAALVRSGGIRRGRDAGRLLESLVRRAREAPGESGPIPAACWSVHPVATGAEEAEELRVRGAVLLRVRGLRAEGSTPAGELHERSPDLAAALTEPRPAPLRELLRLLRGDGALHPTVLCTAVLASAIVVALEALALRGAMQVGRSLGLFEQRLQAGGAFLLLLAALVLLETGITGSLVRLGRRLELRLRTAFLGKIPRLHDRYVQSRPASDMAERSHSVHHLRLMPRFAGNVVRILAQMVVTAGAIAWLSPPGVWITTAFFVTSLGVPLLFLPLLQEQDLRIRTHNGALGRFYLDALLGSMPVRSHGAERAVRREHEGLLVEWIRTSRQRLAALGAFEGVNAAVTVALAGLLLFTHAAASGDAGGMLLLAYWVLLLPTLGAELAFWARQYPVHRNAMLRLMEPLGAPEEPEPEEALTDAPPERDAVDLRFEGVTVRAGGHTILDGVELHVAPGSHVAVVGSSGAGKSTLVGVLLGWHRPSRGRCLVDGRELDAAALDRLRGETAWLDPSVHLWNRALLDNLLYGADGGAGRRIGEALQAADLFPVLHRLPTGLQTPLGEAGGLLSGGEGQRVRLGRALLRPDARLVVVDEPFRGLDREQRRTLLARVRSAWSRATLLCVTHDVGETRGFDRVLVVENGRVVEDGDPARLAGDPASRYSTLLRMEEDAWAGAWRSPLWRRLRLHSGRLTEEVEA